MKTKQIKNLVIVFLVIVLLIQIYNYNYKKESFDSLEDLGSLVSRGPSGGDGRNSFNILRDELKDEESSVNEELADAIRAGIDLDDITSTNPDNDEIINRFTDFLQEKIETNLTRTIQEEIDERVIELASGEALVDVENEVRGIKKRLNNFGGIPDYTVIPFHLTKNNKNEPLTDEQIRSAFGAYTERDSGPVVGGTTSDPSDPRNPLPFGFQVCNGADLQKMIRDANGEITTTSDGNLKVPDYRGRFLMGGGRCAANHNTNGHSDGPPSGSPGYAEGDFYGQGLKGGERRHQLTMGQMPRHDHGFNDPGHAHNVNDPGHSHPNDNFASWNAGSNHRHGLREQSKHADAPRTGTGHTGISIHSSTTGISFTPEGNSEHHNNMPPYFAVLYLIKIKDDS